MIANGKTIRVVYDVFPRQIQGRVKGFTSARPNEYIVVIDASRHPQAQRHTLGHELAHVYLGHFDRAEQRPDGALERQANAWAWEYYRRFRDGTL